jgi:AcrR family transcriptional regulator
MARLPAARRREQLLDVALEVFARQGYHQASMNEIAEAAGVTKPVLYQHFASKQDLYLELLHDVSARLAEAVLQGTADATGPRDQVERGFRAFFEWMAEKPARFGILFTGDTLREPQFSRAAFDTERTTASAIAQLIAVDGMDEQHRLVLGYALVGMSEVLCRQWLNDNVDVKPAEMAEQLANFAWVGLRAVRQVGT